MAGGPTRREILVAALALGLGAAGAFAFRARSRAPSAAPRPRVAVPLPPAARPVEQSADPADAESDRLWKPAEPEDVTYGDFIAMLGFEAKDPVVAPAARELVKAFAAEPELREAALEFAAAEDRGEERNAAQFLETVGRSRAFERVISRFAHQPGASAALLAFLMKPQAAPLAAWAKRIVGKPNASLGRALVRGQIPAGQSWNGAGNYLGTAAIVAQELQRRQSVLASTGTLTASARASMSASAAGLPSGAAAHSAASGREDDGPLPGAHDVDTKLKGTIRQPGSEIMKRLLEQYPWLTNLSQSELLELIRGGMVDDHGLWGACFALKMWKECQRACAADDGVRGSGTERRIVPKCQATPAWNSCLDWKGSEETCVSRCKFQQPCTVPSGVWSRFCGHQIQCCSCCGGGLCTRRDCCRSSFHDGDRYAKTQPHRVCLPAWDGLAAAGTGSGGDSTGGGTTQTNTATGATPSPLPTPAKQWVGQTNISDPATCIRKQWTNWSDGSTSDYLELPMPGCQTCSENAAQPKCK
ncbi:MAG: hypothetical protein HY553_22370 [Elusimicrobia bacterium]|nr:hypothetical protein [Elusimicrobiota bacterium]